jgi:hypothetical protein
VTAAIRIRSNAMCYKFKHLSTGNRKLKAARAHGWYVVSFNIPVLRLCHRAGICKVICYAKKGKYTLPCVKAYRERNLLLIRSEEFFATMKLEIEELVRKSARVFCRPAVRWDDSGDFDREYFIRACAIMRAFPRVKFYAYSKNFELLKGLKQPSNFHMIKSFGGLDDDKIDLENDYHALLVPRGTTEMPQGYTNGSVPGDIVALLGETKKIAIPIR